MCPRSEEYEQTMVWSITFISIIWISSKIDVYFMLSCHQQMVIAWSVITDQRYKERDCFWSPKLNCISSFFWPELNYSKSVKAESFAWGADIPRKDQHAAPERWGCRQRLLLSVMIWFVFLLFLLVYINRNNSRYISIRRHNRWA